MYHYSLLPTSINHLSIISHLYHLSIISLSLACSLVLKMMDKPNTLLPQQPFEVGWTERVAGPKLPNCLSSLRSRSLFKLSYCAVMHTAHLQGPKDKHGYYSYSILFYYLATVLEFLEVSLPSTNQAWSCLASEPRQSQLDANCCLFIQTKSIENHPFASY